MAKDTKGDCEFCESVNVSLYPQHGDMMCDACIQRENAVVKAEAVVATAIQKDDRIELRSDVMTAATTSFIELHSAIENNPSIAETERRYVLADMAVERIKKFDSAIFAQKAELTRLENERMAWLKNTQIHVATLRQDKQAKYAQYSVNYKPVVVTTKAIKGKSTKDVPKGHSNRPISTGSPFTNKQLAEACE